MGRQIGGTKSMGFLHQLLRYHKICIQCHNNTDADALASAYGLQCFFKEKQVSAEIIYGGSETVRRFNLQYMMDALAIEARHVTKLPETELLLVVDGQYGEGNVQTFDAPEIAVIDHHYCVSNENENTFIKSEYQSCSTVVYELLLEEGYPVQENEKLRTALLYGLYMDTSSFQDLYRERDIQMRSALLGENPVFERLTKSSMTMEELMIAGDALQNHYFDPERCFAIVPAIHCEQAVLGIIGDLVIQVDVILASLTYTAVGGGYQFSIRSCDNTIPANQLAAYICEGIGSGGGHTKKAGGRISARSFRKKYGEADIFDVLNRRMKEFIRPAAP